MVQAAVLKVVVLLCAALLQLAAAQSGPFHAHHHTRSYRLCLIQLDTRVVDNVQQNDASNLDTDLESNDASQGPRADNEDKFTKNCIRPSMLINRYARCWTCRMDVCQISNWVLCNPTHNAECVFAPMLVARRKLCEYDEECLYLDYSAHHELYHYIPPVWAKIKVFRHAFSLTSIYNTTQQKGDHSVYKEASSVEDLMQSVFCTECFEQVLKFRPTCETVLWLDSDAIFHVYNEKPSDFVEQLFSNATLDASEPPQIVLGKDPWSVPGEANTGVLIFRNTASAVQVVVEWWRLYEYQARNSYALVPGTEDDPRFLCLEQLVNDERRHLLKDLRLSEETTNTFMVTCRWIGSANEQFLFLATVIPKHTDISFKYNSTLLQNESCGSEAVTASGNSTSVLKFAQRSIFDMNHEGIRHFMAKSKIIVAA